MNKAYVIKNIKSGLFFTRSHTFKELGYNTQMYESYRDAYKDLEMAKNNQVWELLEQIYNTDRFHIDCDMGVVSNVEEHVELRIRGVYMREGNV